MAVYFESAGLFKRPKLNLCCATAGRAQKPQSYPNNRDARAARSGRATEVSEALGNDRCGACTGVATESEAARIVHLDVCAARTGIVPKIAVAGGKDEDVGPARSGSAVKVIPPPLTILELPAVELLTNIVWP